ncbi:hypothetical protein Ciccas_014302 [Cichlidogyrus casuarinus]|uniref:Ig-like domain-containing protein n=1 Tax=Cichlidogyrus casuarinus TaxID=1844966 RepID=A0ABD2PNA2_9PLAT
MSVDATSRLSTLAQPDAVPRFLSNLQASANTLDEGEPLQFLVEISRINDVTVEWFKNGQILNAGQLCY